MALVASTCDKCMVFGFTPPSMRDDRRQQHVLTVISQLLTGHLDVLKHTQYSAVDEAKQPLFDSLTTELSTPYTETHSVLQRAACNSSARSWPMQQHPPCHTIHRRRPRPCYNASSTVSERILALQMRFFRCDADHHHTTTSCSGRRCAQHATSADQADIRRPRSRGPTPGLCPPDLPRRPLSPANNHADMR